MEFKIVVLLKEALFSTVAKVETKKIHCTSFYANCFYGLRKQSQTDPIANIHSLLDWRTP